MLESETKLPSMSLSREKKQEYYKIMLKGNVVLKKWHKKVVKKLYNERIVDWREKGKLGSKPKEPKFSRSKLRAEIFNKIKSKSKSNVPTDICVRGFTIPSRDLKKILSVREIEWNLLCGFSGLITFYSNTWSAHNNSYLGFDDLYNESVCALMNAIYQYTDPGVKFITFAMNAIRNTMINLAARENYFWAWTTEGAHLYQLYEKTKMNLNGPATFDEVAEFMKITISQKALLANLLQKVVKQSTLDGLFDDQEDTSLDYSALSVELGSSYRIVGRSSNSTPVYRKDDCGKFEPDVVDDTKLAAKRVRGRLNDWEIKVLDAFLEGGWGWATKIAKESKNPKTGKPYSRMAPNIALERIKNMILDEYAEILEQTLEAA